MHLSYFHCFFAPYRLVKEYSSTELASVLLIIYGLTACFHPRLIRPWHFSSQLDVPHPDAKGVLLHWAVIHSVTHEHVHAMLGHPSSVQLASTGHKGHPGAHILNKAFRLISSCLTKLTKCLFPATEIMHLNVKKIKMHVLYQSITHLRISCTSSGQWKSHFKKSECVIIISGCN